MFTTYILQNTLSGKHYIGSTNNIFRRLSEHNRGQTRSTHKKGSWNLIYTENYFTSAEAKKREKVIKSYKGGNAFRNLFHGSMVDSPLRRGDTGTLTPLAEKYSR